jgi:hypothetical protein
MINKEQITYYTSVTFIHGAWQAYCYIEVCSPSIDDLVIDNIKEFSRSSTFGAAHALSLIAEQIAKWEKENIKS